MKLTPDQEHRAVALTEVTEDARRMPIPELQLNRFAREIIWLQDELAERKRRLEVMNHALIYKTGPPHPDSNEAADWFDTEGRAK